jgi:CheY-like chemotaxis protein
VLFERHFFSKLFSVKSNSGDHDVEPAKLRILLVDRDDYDLIMIKKLFSYSFHVVTFGNELDAISYVRNHPIDIAFIADDFLNRINGAKLLFFLRENSKAFFRAFALINYISDAQRNHLISAGFEDTICKPVDYTLVNDLIYYKRMTT